MKKTVRGFFALVAAGTLALGACSNNSAKDTPSPSAAASEPAAEATSQATGTVSITDSHGTQEVPVNPERVVSLDNRTFETLHEWGVKLLAAPKDVMPKDDPYVKDDSVVNIGNHREPNFEAITAANPDLVIVGQRFAQHYDKIKAAAPNAAIIDMNIKLPKEEKDADANKSGELLMDGMKKDVEDLGKIFGKEKEAAKLNADLDAAIAAARDAYPAGQKVLSINTNGGKMGYLAPGVGRTLGPLYPLLNLTPAFDLGEGTANHKGDEVSDEALAQANPEWILIMDRDAGVGEGNEAHGADLVTNSPAMANVPAVQKKQILTMPADTYVNEGPQTYIEFLNDLAKAFKAAK
ncbi:ABC transporter substrate-binding protein [Actinotignum sanguinis]|uniref:ABC transporter substrate-binding protein n=1 Tax=Actinotignum sanguinis TaxID=1445614 RepID=A0ABT5V814_9ACTO|nr:ABC transporter substrate-binding protein [Actinotignum sanguinis]MDE1656117.1 ABC transporter substrate-binding protein [Actinotignum sanguinis]MDK7197890.1 ABC transporter substrate-binding protein [Actinotignum sanguinis]